MSDTDKPATGGVSIPEAPTGTPTEPPPAPPSPSGDAAPYAPVLSADQSNSSVPEQGHADTAYDPQVVVPEYTTSPDSHVVPPTKGRSIGKRLVLFSGIVLGLVAVFFGGRFLLGLLSGPQEVTITYWGLWENDAVVRPVIESFEAENPSIKVDYVKQSHPQYRERLQSAIAQNVGPDVFRFHNSWVAMIYKDLAKVPTDVMTTDEFAANFYEVARGDLVASDNSIYGIPLMVDGLGLYINEELFATAGVAPPTTWEEVLAITPQLTVRSDSGIVTSAIALGTATNVEHFSDIVATMMLQNGAKLTDVTSQEAQEALLFYRKFSDPVDPIYTWDESLDNSIFAFASGRVAMILAPSWRAFDIAQINPELQFRITPIPQLPGHTVTWASYWVEGVSSKSEEQEAAWKFVSYLTGREGAVKLYTEASKLRLFGEPYARRELKNLIEGDPYVDAYVSQADSAKSFPLASRTFDNGINDKMIKYLEDAINSMGNGAAPSAALDTAASGFRQVLGTYGLASSAPDASSQ